MLVQPVRMLIWPTLAQKCTLFTYYRPFEQSEALGLPLVIWWFLVLNCVYSKQPIFGLTQEWLREFSFSRLECGVHDKLHISGADWWDLLLPLGHRHRGHSSVT